MKPSLLVIAMMIAISGCATASSKWKEVYPGQSSGEVQGLMGGADEFRRDESGKVNALVWQIDDFRTCHVTLGSDGRVAEKSCAEDGAGRAAHNAQIAERIRRNNAETAETQRRNNEAYLNTFQSRKPTQTNCQSRWVGGTQYTDCNSR